MLQEQLGRMPFQGKHSPTSACGCDRPNVLSKQEPKEGLLGEEQRPPAHQLPSIPPPQEVPSAIRQRLGTRASADIVPSTCIKIFPPLHAKWRRLPGRLSAEPAMAFPCVSGPVTHIALLFVLRNQTEPGGPKLGGGFRKHPAWLDRGEL